MSADAPGAANLAWEWRATGTVWRLHHDGCVDAALSRDVAAAVERDEARWSRFRASSELTAINEGAGSPVEVSPETLELLSACLEWREWTGGIFEPLVGAAVAAWGYVSGIQTAAPFVATSPESHGIEGAIEIDREEGTARIPAGAKLDLGGIAKGWMADRAATLLREAVPCGRILVDAGGDIAAARHVHVVAIEGEPIVRIMLEEGNAVATSGWMTRSWQNGDGRVAHHLIDPVTGTPAVRSHATVVARGATAADVLAKALAIRPGRIATLPLPARVRSELGCETNSAWEVLVEPACESLPA